MTFCTWAVNKIYVLVLKMFIVGLPKHQVFLDVAKLKVIAEKQINNNAPVLVFE